ncbi:hypothetical protein AY600_10235 [Phormidium willei BDU 130791]|nr:hypothetical protein AY600_10235 [Phormidium willei BDU 130791]
MRCDMRRDRDRNATAPTAELGAAEAKRSAALSDQQTGDLAGRRSRCGGAARSAPVARPMAFPSGRGLDRRPLRRGLRARAGAASGGSRRAGPRAPARDHGGN